MILVSRWIMTQRRQSFAALTATWKKLSRRKNITTPNSSSSAKEHSFLAWDRMLCVWVLSRSPYWEPNGLQKWKWHLFGTYCTADSRWCQKFLKSCLLISKNVCLFSFFFFFSVVYGVYGLIDVWGLLSTFGTTAVEFAHSFYRESGHWLQERNRRRSVVCDPWPKDVDEKEIYLNFLHKSVLQLTCNVWMVCSTKDLCSRKC